MPHFQPILKLYRNNQRVNIRVTLLEARLCYSISMIWHEIMHLCKNQINEEWRVCCKSCFHKCAQI